MQIYGKIEEILRAIFRKSGYTVTIEPPATTAKNYQFNLPNTDANSAAVLVTDTHDQTLTNKTLTLPKIDQINEATPNAGVTADGVLCKDGTVTLEDPGVGTKVATLQAGTMANDSTFTLPIATDTLVGLASSGTLTNKTIDGDDNTVQDLGLGTLKTDAGNAYKLLQRGSSGAVEVAGTAAAIIPTGTTAQKPGSSLVAGMTRFNTDLLTCEIYNGAAWQELMTFGQVVKVAKTGARFSDVQSALTYITGLGDASAVKPYLIDVGPGVFSGAFTPINYVSIKGAGTGPAGTVFTHTSTVVSGTLSASDAIVTFSNFSVLLNSPTADDQRAISLTGNFGLFDVQTQVLLGGNYSTTGIFVSFPVNGAITLCSSIIISATATTKNMVGIEIAGAGDRYASNSLAKIVSGAASGILAGLLNSGTGNLSAPTMDTSIDISNAAFSGTVRGICTTSVGSASTARLFRHPAIRLTGAGSGTAVASCLDSGGSSADNLLVGATVFITGFTTNQEYITETDTTDKQRIYLNSSNKVLLKTGAGRSVVTPQDDEASGFLEFTGGVTEPTAVWSRSGSTFNILYGGSGIVRGVPVMWEPGSITLTDLATNFIYVTSAGVIANTTVPTDALFLENIVLFSAFYDAATSPYVLVTKENHPYKFTSAVSREWHNSFGTLLDGTGTNMVQLGAAGNCQFEITGTDTLRDHGLSTTVSSSGGLAQSVTYFWYNDGTAKPRIYGTASTIPDALDTGSATSTVTTNKFVVFRFYVMKSSFVASAAQFLAILPITQFTSLALAQTAISTGAVTIQTMPAALEYLEPAQIGYIIMNKNPGGSYSIAQVIIEKKTFTAKFLGSSGTGSTAGLISTSVADFGGELSSADVNVQAALDRLDDYDTLLDWATAKDYRIGNIVRVTTEGFVGEWRCLTAHTAAAAVTTDINSGYWEIVANSEGSRELVNSASHGFVAGDVLYHTGTVYAKAKADTLVTSRAIGIVTGATTNFFVLAKTGKITKTGWALTAGSLYYLSAATAGALTTTKPEGYYIVQLGVAPSTTTIQMQICIDNYWDNCDPTEIAGIPPTLDLDFSAAGLPSTVTFTRSTIGTYFDADSYLKTAAVNVPRIEYDPATKILKGLLIEEARTNLLTYTEHFENSYWSKTRASIGADITTAPDGSLSADKLIMDTTGTTSHYTYANNVAISSSTTYTVSVYLKASEITWARMEISDGAGSVYYGTYVNLSTGTLGTALSVGAPTATNRKIEPVGNGWYRVSITVNLGAYTTADVIIYLAEADVDITFATGDGKSGIYIWGAQLEAGEFPSSYAPSTDTFTSRTDTGAGIGKATYYNSTGTLVTAADGVARNTYNPDPSKLHLGSKLLLEPVATNIYLQSETLATSPWSNTRCSISANTTVAPDGNTTADTMTEDTSAGTTHYMNQNALAVTVDGIYTASIYAKKGTKNEIEIQFLSDNSAFAASATNFNLDTKVITLRSGITNVLNYTLQELPNGWYRCSVTAKATATANAKVGFGTANAGTPAGTETIILWGAQMEGGTGASAAYAPTSYIATTTASLTRNADAYTTAALARTADNASMTGTNVTNWFRWDEGTFYVDWFDKIQSASHTIFQVYQDGSNRIDFSPNNSNVLDAGIIVNGSDTLTGLTPTIAVAANRATVAYKANDGNVSHNGVVGTTDTSVTLPNLSTPVLWFGARSSGSTMMNGHIRRLIFWPARIDNTKIQQMTV